MAILFSPDPTHEDLRDFMDEGERRFYDTVEGTQGVFLEAELADLWRSIPDPTEEQLRQLMRYEEWGQVQGGENAEGILSFYRRKWKKDRKDAAIEEREAHAPAGSPWSRSSNAMDGVIHSLRDGAKRKSSDPEVERNTKAQEEANEILRQAAEKQIEKEKTTGGIRVPAQRGGPIERDERDSALLRFMPKQLRAEYDKADPERKAMLWEANRGAFEEAKERKQVRLLAEQVQTQRILDMLQRVREDASKADLLPPADATMDELLNWYDEMSKPIRPIPFPGEGGVDAKATTDTTKANPGAPQDPKPKYPHGNPAGPFSRNPERLPYRYQELSPSPTFVPIGQTDFSEPSILEKLWRLTESNLFWGGGVGVALAAYAFEIGGAPRFAVLLLVMAWLVFTISIFRHGFFERSPNGAEFIYQSLISLAIVAVLVITWILLHPITVQPAPLGMSNTPTPGPTVTMSPPVVSAPNPTPKASLQPTPSQSPAIAYQSPQVAFPTDVKIGLLQCNVSTYEDPSGYRTLPQAVCIAKHQQVGQEFIGTVGAESVANINLPYGFYTVTIKAEGYITRVEAVKIDKEVNSIGVVLQRAH